MRPRSSRRVMAPYSAPGPRTTPANASMSLANAWPCLGPSARLVRIKMGGSFGRRSPTGVVSRAMTRRYYVQRSYARRSYSVGMSRSVVALINGPRSFHGLLADGGRVTTGQEPTDNHRDQRHDDQDDEKVPHRDAVDKRGQAVVRVAVGIGDGRDIRRHRAHQRAEESEGTRRRRGDGTTGIRAGARCAQDA